MNMITDFVRVCSASPAIKVGDVEYKKNSSIKERNNALKKNTEVINNNRMNKNNKDEEIKDLKKHQNYFLFFLLGFIASLVVEKFL